MSPCEVIKNLCRQCGKQFSRKRGLAIHKRAVHEGVKYPCGQCNYQATTKGSLAEHKRAVHEGVKYPCGQCNHQATTKGNLAKHKRAVHQATEKRDLTRHQRSVHKNSIYEEIQSQTKLGGDKRIEHEKVKKKQKRFEPLLRSGAFNQILNVQR